MALWFTIPPANYLDTMIDWQYHMVIAPHMLNNEKYKKFYIEHPDLYTMIDNGLWEGQVVDNPTLLALAQDIKADEIIAPDDITAEKTIHLTEGFLKFLEQRKQRKDFFIHGVVHGQTKEERVWCLDSLIVLNVDIIDLPKMLGPKDRATFLDEVTKRTDKPVHFLGYYKEEKDLLSGQWCTSIRSFDTSVPFKPKYTDKFNLNLPISPEYANIICGNVEEFAVAFNMAGGETI